MKLKVKDQLLNCEVKNSHEGITTGMQGRGQLNGCMVFMLPYKGEQSFWMKDCLIPLDIVFCDNNKVTTINHSCMPCDQKDCPTYRGYGNIALEFNGGFCRESGLKEGDTISFIQ